MSGSVGDNPYRASGVIAAAAAGGGTSWQSVETGATFTAVAGNGYPVNTTAQACTVTLPASASVGDTIQFTDYARTWGTNALTIDQNSLNFQGASTPNPIYDADLQSVTIVYVDATQGWIPTTDDVVNYETGPPYAIDFLVIAGGGSGGSTGNSGGGGAGGYRTATESSVSTGTAITITVGDGAAGVINLDGITGSASSFSGPGLTTISSAGGGGGGKSDNPGLDGGSGGGSGYSGSGGASAPVTDPVQGHAGGTGAGHIAPAYGASGGGGASEVGAGGTGSEGGDGGDGVASSISGSSVTRAGGGGGGTNTTIGSGGAGGGGDSVTSGNGEAGTVNTGSGGGACEDGSTSGAGGKGVVVLSMPDASYSGTTTGSPTVATGQGGGSDTTTLVYTGTGSYTA